MDILKTTLEVIENTNVSRENLSSKKFDLKQCQEYINQLKENLEETQTLNTQNLEILEINNLTKNAFNENCKLVKKLFGKVYDYTQQIQEKLNTILQEENALNESFNDNTERMKRLENKFINETKLLVILEKDDGEKVAKKTFEIESAINNIKTEQNHYEELWKNVMDEFEIKQKMLETIKLETEVLQDKIDTENQQLEKLTQEYRKKNLNLFEEIKNEIKKDKTFELETEEVLLLSHKCKEIFKSKEKFIQKQFEIRKTLELLDKKCANIEVRLSATEAENNKRIKLLHLEIESKNKTISDKEIELSSCEEKAKQSNDELEQITLKISSLEDELRSLSSYAHENEKKIVKKVNDVSVSQEYDSLTKKSKELLELLSKCEEEIHEKKNELNTIRTIPSLELSEINRKIQQVELKSAETVQLEIKEIEEIEFRNKNFQEAADSHETALKEFEIKMIQLNVKNEQINQEMKNLILQCDNIEKEIQRLEASKQKGIKITPTPAPKRLTPKRARNPPKRKRQKSFDLESNSSIEGEKLNYAEFMAKKKIGQEKKQKW
ncbi:myosin-J heavy chain-like [Tribolium madens]|uniref:myosin-J heavy chain-like n=1 Tax=Tribolium madens TaxID=41895 RepID=UPI001CF74FE0|nr:myosin-J heavy chain-like [Tribolium madens]